MQNPLQVDNNSCIRMYRSKSFSNACLFIENVNGENVWHIRLNYVWATFLLAFSMHTAQATAPVNTLKSLQWPERGKVCQPGSQIYAWQSRQRISCFVIFVLGLSLLLSKNARYLGRLVLKHYKCYLLYFSVTMLFRIPSNCYFVMK